MRLTRRIWIQLSIFVLVALVAGSAMTIHYIRLPAMLFGVGHYTVTVELPASAGLYAGGNVTYRGSEVGRVADVRLTDTGVQARMNINNGVSIPSDLRAAVHSQSAIGEQYIALTPESSDAAPLRDGDVIPVDRSSVPPPVDKLLDATSTALQAIPNDNLKTAVDESYLALGGLGSELARLVDGSTTVAIDARRSLGELTALVDQSGPILDTQSATADSISAWAAHLATITDQLRNRDADVAGIMRHGADTTDEVRKLFDRVKPTLPVLLANLVSVGRVAISYQANIEQILVMAPQGISYVNGAAVAGVGTKQAFHGSNLAFKINLNLPPPCTTGYLPASQMRPPSMVDSPDRPAADLYCRIPQDSQFNVRGARNIPCAEKPWKRAPTVAICESDQDYVPLNDGQAWKGDPNATLSGQDIPHVPPAAAQPDPPAAPPVPIAFAEYDPATGTYRGPDGKVYTQTDLAQGSAGKTWQSMLTPP